MKRILFILCAAVISGLAFAQSPVITHENVYLIGDQSQIAWCSNDAEPGDDGADITWDFSGLNEIEEQVFDYVEPATTIFGYQFPNATLCGVGMDNYHSFYRVSDNHLIVEGYAGYEEGSTDTLKILYSDVEELIPLPFEYGDTHFDTFEGLSQVMGFEASLEGEIDLEVDGYGTLILPNGTFENVVRYHFNRTQDNTIFGQTSTVTKEQWGWMSADHRFWLCLMETNNDGFGEEDIVWYAKNPLILSADNLEVQEISIFPNPSSGDQKLYFDSNFEANATVQLYALDGKLINQENRFISLGTNEIIPEKQLASGMYTVIITSENKRLVSKLIIRQV